jgi:hypothetical protein
VPSRSIASPFFTDRAALVPLDRVIPLDNLVELGIRPLVERTARGKIIVDPQAA